MLQLITNGAVVHEISPLALHPIRPVDRHPIAAAFHRLQHHRPHFLRRAGDAPDPDLRCRNTTAGDLLDVECTGSGTELWQELSEKLETAWLQDVDVSAV